MSSLLDVRSLSCGYQNQVIVSSLDFSVGEGEIACLLGPSGCGKTTVLRAVAGFSPVFGGEISLEGKTISSAEFTLVPEKRGMGMVFQDYALFPHLTVGENIRFGLGKTAGRNQKQRIVEMLDLVRLPDLSKRYPHELSGGQQQRVALARALAPQPKLLLMDEPFSNLDTDLRQQLSLEVKDILKQQGIAAIVVTHDQQEAFAIGDKVGILADGELQQWGSPQELYHHPVNAMVAGFVGKGELFSGRCLNEFCVETELGTLEFAEPCCATAGDEISLFIRPNDLKPVVGGKTASVRSFEFLGDATRYQLQLNNGRNIEAMAREPLKIDTGDTVGVEVSVHKPIVF
ncbi:ABC transporter ATP-binding protein [Pontibacterium sp.]|uniref:ABC transporter ATP-binding protein n=1 Tax=Pontibacterium sp. TaxID=2036026 RepID=UPI00351196C6